MPSWLTTVLTLFDVLWLIAVLIFLYLIWRRGVSHTQQIEQTLIKATMKTAEAAQTAAEAACMLAAQRKVVEDKPPL